MCVDENMQLFHEQVDIVNVQERDSCLFLFPKMVQQL